MRSLATGAAGPAVEDHRQLDVFGGRQVRQQVARGLLPDEADNAPPVEGALATPHGGEIVARDGGASGRRDVEAAQDAQQGRLARARRADDGDHLRRIDQQVESLEGHHLEVGDLVDLDEVVARDLRALAEGAAPRASRREGRTRLDGRGSGQVDDLAALVACRLSHRLILADSLDALPRGARQAGAAPDPAGERDPDRQHRHQRKQQQSDHLPVDHQRHIDR